jgi:hypothetical protein
MLAIGMAAIYTVVLLVASRLWHAGRLSDHAETLVVVGLAPLFGIAYAVVTGAPLVVIAVVAVIALVVPLALYRTVADLVREQGDLPRAKTGRP